MNSANFISTNRKTQEVEMRMTSGSSGTVLLGAGRLCGNVASNSPGRSGAK